MSKPEAYPTFARFHLPGDFHLALNHNKKMKTILVTASFVGNLDETVTRMALLPMILRRGTRRHPSMQAVSRFLEGLFGTSLLAYVVKIGEWHVVRSRLEVVNERFLPGEKGLFRQAVEFLVEFLHDPLQVGDGFQPEFLEQEKSQLKCAIEALVDDKNAYAEQRLIEAMCPHEPYRLHELGRVEDIAAIEPKGLLELHRRWVATHPLHVYVAGDIDIEATRDLIAAAFAAGPGRRQGGYAIKGAPPAVPVQGVREVEENMDVQQAKLFLGFRHGITNADPDFEALLVMNGILGGFSHSKLFQNVREKANLAYSVHSSIDRTKGLLTIAMGIAPENHERALKIALEQLDAMRAGEITDDEMASTLATLLNSNEMLEDNLGVLGDVDFIWGLHGRQFDFASFRERLRRVRKDDVVAAAHRLALDTTYWLTSHSSASPAP